MYHLIIRRYAVVFAFILAVAPRLLAQSDTQPPQLVNETFTPVAVDVTSSSQTVVFQVHATDDLSGVGQVSIFLSSPSGMQTVFGDGAAPGITLDTTVSVNVTIPRYAEPGNWMVNRIDLFDRVLNRNSLNTAALSAAGFPTTLSVTDANPDTQAPTIGSISMSPNAVDVSSSAATVTVLVQFLDAQSGFSAGNIFVANISTLSDFEIRSPSGKQSRFISILDWRLMSGTVNNGVWQASFSMPRYSEPGTWTISSIRTHDAAGNNRFFSPADLSSLGSSLNLSVTSTPFDITPPKLTGLVFTPSVINTSLGAQTIQTDFLMTDDLSGVGSWPDTPDISICFCALFFSPSGAQFTAAGSGLSNVPPVSGTPLNGDWRFNASFPQFSEAGTWQVEVFLRDNVRNLLILNNAQLGALGIPNTITVIKPSLVPDGTISNPAAGGTVSDDVFGNRAQIIVPGGVLSQPTTVAIDVLQSPLQVPLPTGFSTAETYYVNIQVSPTPSFPLPAPGITVVLPLRNSGIPGTSINLFSIDPATGNLVPVLDPVGNPVVGVVDASGLTATFVGVTHFSTLVGLLPTVPTDTIPPVTVASLNPPPNSNGWDRANVTVTLASTDNEAGGTGVKQIQFSASGAQPMSLQTVGGSTATLDITNEGVTTITYFGSDGANNVEAPKSITVRLDKTPPVISGLPSPGCSLWPPNHKFVQVADVKANDALSGLAPASLTVAGTSNEPSDPSDPNVLVMPDGSGGFTVQLRAERDGNGNGRVYSLSAAAADLAGNVANATATCTVPHDQGKN
jgi:hypothetical protein